VLALPSETRGQGGQRPYQGAKCGGSQCDGGRIHLRPLVGCVVIHKHEIL
jgi:hypothetical protein